MESPSHLPDNQETDDALFITLMANLKQLYKERNAKWLKVDNKPNLANAKLEEHIKRLSKTTVSSISPGFFIEALHNKLNILVTEETKDFIETLKESENENMQENLANFISFIKELQAETQKQLEDHKTDRLQQRIQSSIEYFQDQILQFEADNKLRKWRASERRSFLLKVVSCIDNYINSEKKSEQCIDDAIKFFVDEMTEILPSSMGFSLEPIRHLNVVDLCDDVWHNSITNLNESLKNRINWYATLGNLVNCVSGNYKLQQKLKKVTNKNGFEEKTADEKIKEYFVALEGDSELIDWCQFVALPQNEILFGVETLSDLLKPPKSIKDDKTWLIMGTGEFHFSDVFKTNAPIKWKNILVLTKGTVFIDQTITGSVSNLLICGNTIEVCTESEILLEGESASDLLKADNEEICDKNGRDGRNGENGGNGGNIYIIMNTIINPSPLKLISKGGSGGKGEDGGDGHGGIDDHNFSVEQYKRLFLQFKYFDTNLLKLTNILKLNYPEYTCEKLFATIKKGDKEETKYFSTPNEEIFREIKNRWASLVFISLIIEFLENPAKYKCLCSHIQGIRDCFENIDIFGNYIEISQQYCKLSVGKESKDCEMVLALRKFRDFFDFNSQNSKNKMASKYDSLLNQFKCHRGGISSVADNELMKTANKALNDFCELLSKQWKEKMRKKMPEELEKKLPKVQKEVNVLQAKKDSRAAGKGGKGGRGGLGGYPGGIVVPSLEQLILKPILIFQVGEQGIPGKGGIGGVNGQNKDNYQVSFADNGADGDKHNVDASSIHTKNQLDDWDPEKACKLNEVLEKLNIDQRSQFASILTSHEWTCKHVLSSEFFLDECLYLFFYRTVTENTTPFSKSYLTYLLKYQNNLEVFYSKHYEAESNNKILQRIRGCTFYRIKNIQMYLTNPPLISNLSAKCEATRERLNIIKESELQTLYADYLSEHLKRIENKCQQLTLSANDTLSAFYEEIHQTVEKLLEFQKRDLESYIKVLRQIGWYEKGALGIKLAGVIGSIIALISGNKIGKEANGILSCLATGVEALAPKLDICNAIKRPESLYYKRFVADKAEALKCFINTIIYNKTVHKTQLNKIVMKPLQRLQDIKTDLSKYNCSESTFLLERIALFEQTKVEIFKTLEAHKLQCANQEPDLSSYLDIFTIELMCSDPTISNLYYETEETKYKGFRRNVGLEETKNTEAAMQRDLASKVSFAPMLYQLLAIVKTHICGEGETTIPVWKLRDILDNLKSYFKNFVSGLPSEIHFDLVFKKIKNAIDVQVGFFANINKLHEAKEMHLLQANMSGNFKSVGGVHGTGELENKMLKVQFQTQSDMLLIEFENIHRALLQWAFPYPEIFWGTPEDNRKKPEINLGNNQDSCSIGKLKGDISKLGLSYIEAVDHMIRIYKQSHGESTRLKDKIFYHYFTCGPDNRPLCEWNNANYSRQIRKLLLGKQIKLLAPVMLSHTKKAAVKVNGKVHLIFTCPNNSDIQKELKTALNAFNIEMIHSGVSVYRVNNEFYEIRNAEAITLLCDACCESHASQEMRTENKTRKDIEDYVLSPFSEWKFQLKLSNPDMTDSSEFAKLADKFSRYIDLALVGPAIYFDEQSQKSQCESFRNLSSYYHKINPEAYQYRMLCE